MRRQLKGKVSSSEFSLGAKIFLFSPLFILLSSFLVSVQCVCFFLRMGF